MEKKSCKDSIFTRRRKPSAAGEPIVLGITGGIAGGKSLITSFFQDLGAAVLSADALAREVVSPGERAFNAIVAHFGEGILTKEGTIDRSLLAEKIFLSPRERETLNRLTHPAIGRLADQRLAALGKDPEVPLIVYEAPLLFESRAERRVDLVLVVAISPELQLERLMHRDNLSKDEALQRIAAQMPLAEKISRADLLVDNNGPPEQTQRDVARIFSELTTPKKKKPPESGEF